MADASKIDLDIRQDREIQAVIQQAAKDICTLALRFGNSSTERNRAAAKAEAEADLRQINARLYSHLDALEASGLDFDALIARRRSEAVELRWSDYLKDVLVEPKPGKINHSAPGARLAAAETAARRPETDHITSVTVALGATLSLAISGRSDDSRTPTITLRAEGGTAIGVPTVAVDQLRAAGLVL